MPNTPDHKTELHPTRTNLWLGVAVITFAALTLFVWIPLDVESGIFEKVRRRTEIGDAFAPTLAAVLLALGGVLLVIDSARNSSFVRLNIHTLKFTFALLAVVVTFTAFVITTGPALVALIGADGADYRSLRDTVPWKYSGFLMGGTFLVASLISLVEQKFTWQSLAIGLAASLALIALYDLPFDTLLLPPNGDV